MSPIPARDLICENKTPHLQRRLVDVPAVVELECRVLVEWVWMGGASGMSASRSARCARKRTLFTANNGRFADPLDPSIHTSCVGWSMSRQRSSWRAVGGCSESSFEMASDARPLGGVV